MLVDWFGPIEEDVLIFLITTVPVRTALHKDYVCSSKGDLQTWLWESIK